MKHQYIVCWVNASGDDQWSLFDSLEAALNRWHDLKNDTENSHFHITKVLA